MFFCEKCRYLYGVTKDVQNKQIGGRITEGLNNLFNKFSKDEPITEKDIRKLSGKHVVNDERYEILNKKDQRRLMSAIKSFDKNFFLPEESESETKVGANIAYFICKFCKHHIPIKPGTTIYSKKYGSTNTAEIDDYSYAIYDQTLQRTRNYICKNEKCETHKKIDLKEAVITKNVNEQIVYICTYCSTYWINSL